MRTSRKSTLIRYSSSKILTKNNAKDSQIKTPIIVEEANKEDTKTKEHTTTIK